MYKTIRYTQRIVTEDEEGAILPGMGKPAYSWFWLLLVLLYGTTYSFALAQEIHSPQEIGYYCHPDTESIVEGQYYQPSSEPCFYQSASLGAGFRYGDIYHGTIGSSTIINGHALGLSDNSAQWSDPASYIQKNVQQGDDVFVVVYHLRNGPAFENDLPFFRQYFTGERSTPPHLNYGFIRFKYGEQPATCLENCNSNVLFLPGIQSSRLYRPDYNGGTEKLWEPGGVSDVEDLYLQPNGSSLRDDVYTKEGHVLDELPLTQENIYESFLNDLEQWKVHDDIIEDYGVIAYDWRLSLDDILSYGNLVEDRLYYSGVHRATSTPYILQELRKLATSSRNGKVTIVAHSNGGLVAKALIKHLQDSNDPLLESIDNLILVAVPQLGTPQALGAVLHGYDQALPFSWLPLLVTPEHARAFASTSPMAHHLLPSETYLSIEGVPLITFEPGGATQPYIDAYGESIDSYEELRSFLLGLEGRNVPDFDDVKSPAPANVSLLSYAESVHEELDTWVSSSTTRVHLVAGSNEETLSGIRYFTGFTCTEVNIIGVCKSYEPIMLYSPTMTFDGDGTVIDRSALAGDGNKWWVNLKEYNRLHINRDHKNILEVQDVRNEVLKILQNTHEGAYAYMGHHKPPATEGGILSFILHSPLSLSIIDAAGNVVSANEVSIPGAEYKKYGEVQYISVPSLIEVTARLDGEGYGSFTFEVREKEGPAVDKSIIFSGISVTPSTTVLLEVRGGVEGTGPLQIDHNSDGEIDLTLQPRIDEIVLPDISPPTTTAHVSGTAGLNGWFTSNVSIIFSISDDSPIVATHFSIDGMATSTGNSLEISSEGMHQVRFYSIDQQGNQESTNSIYIKIDKTPPEVWLEPNEMTKDIKIGGLDAVSTTTTYKSDNGYIISDGAGNSTKVILQNKYLNKSLVLTSIQSLQYGNEAPILMTSKLAYVWSMRPPFSLLSQTIISKSGYVIEALFNPIRNTTKIVELNKDEKANTFSIQGLAKIKLTSNLGDIIYSW